MSSDDIYYHLSIAKRVEDDLGLLEARAAAAGRGAEFANAFLTMHRWLRADPASLGEPVRDYPQLRLTEYSGSYGPLAVTNSIHWDLRLVFIVKNLRFHRWAGF